MKYGKSAALVLAAAVLGLFVAGNAALSAGNSAVREKQASPQGPQSRKKSEIKVTFVELGSVNCVPCRMMQPVMEEIEKEYGHQVKVVFHDVWTKEGSPYGDKYRIRAIPTQVFLDSEGKEFFRHQGFFPKEEILKVLRKQGVK